ncbi:MAG TPA: anti-sigma factor antagonist [Caldithrix abyssi]|uniref:Anti-sigma factor antagonist n=1 Tax=Caldithrix abyssi TaxID=187145 RepID=A0A7V4UET2_CALAY|nr:anti-sigma factor antagonist [Caldithrix abyssi]
MFEVVNEDNKGIRLRGRFDATQVNKAARIFNALQNSATVYFDDLEYISSAGLSVLLKTQKRLKANGQQLILKNMSKHIREIFKYAGFDMIFKIE